MTAAKQWRRQIMHEDVLDGMLIKDGEITGGVSPQAAWDHLSDGGDHTKE